MLVRYPHAPSKRYVEFDRSAHMIMFEEPGKLFLHLVRDVRPLAVDGRPGEVSVGSL